LSVVCVVQRVWIRIDLIRIRIQPFCSIRIQAKTELSKTIFLLKFV
jgi:hypothetical protein